MNTLEQLVKRACELYKEDTLAPSIVTSWVKDAWYVSIVRWLGPRNSMERKVVLKAEGPDLEACFMQLLGRLA